MTGPIERKRKKSRRVLTVRPFCNRETGSWKCPTLGYEVISCAECVRFGVEGLFVCKAQYNVSQCDLVWWALHKTDITVATAINI